MERGSDKVSRRIDDELKHDTEGIVRGGHGTHAEEWKGSEPSGEDQPDVDLSPDGTLTGGVPEGMSSEEVERRSELASYLGRAAYPVVSAQLIELAVDRHAPDWVIDLLHQLPAGRTYDNLQDVWATLGGHFEQHRF